MTWIIALCCVVAWTLVALPLAIAVGRAFEAGHRRDETAVELPSDLDGAGAPMAGEPGRGSAA